jgi:tetratricopeptide (TPR) repeat protein
MQRRFLIVAATFLNCFTIPCDINAQDAAYYANRGEAWNRKGEYDKAIADYSEALRLNPSYAYANACYTRAIAP